MQSSKIPVLSSALLLAGCALVAAATMFKNLSYGLPFYYHPDEVGKLFNIGAIVNGAGAADFKHPHFLLFFSLPFIYLGKMLSADALLSARAATATLGVATACLLFITGRYLAGSLAGFSAALVFATAPLAVIAAHDFKEDIPLAFWLTLQTFFLLRYLRDRRARDLWLAAAAFGFSVGTKYTGLLSLPLLIGAALFERKEGWIGRIGIVIVVAVAGFVCATPDILWHPLRFVEGVGYELRHVMTGHLSALHDVGELERRLRISPVDHVWTYHLFHSLIPGLSAPGVLLALAGAVLAMRRDSQVCWLLCAALLIYYLAIETLPLKSPPFAARYMVPLLPFAALLAGSAFSLARQERSWIRGAVGCLFVGTLVVNGHASYRQVWSMRPETRDEAREWILTRIPYDARLMIPGLDSYYPFGDLSLAAPGTDQPYELVRMDGNADYALRAAASDPKSYLVLSSFTYQRYLDYPEIDPNMHRFYQTLLEEHTPVAKFESPIKPLGFHNPTIAIYHSAGAFQR